MRAHGTDSTITTRRMHADDQGTVYLVFQRVHVTAGLTDDVCIGSIAHEGADWRATPTGEHGRLRNDCQTHRTRRAAVQWLEREHERYQLGAVDFEGE